MTLTDAKITVEEILDRIAAKRAGIMAKGIEIHRNKLIITTYHLNQPLLEFEDEAALNKFIDELKPV